MITVTVDNDAERDAMMCALFVRDFDYRITRNGQPVAWRENGTYGGYAATEGRPVA